MWQPSLNYVEKYYSITNDESDSSGQKRRFKTWVTDAIFLPNCNKLVIGSTSRDIRFYDCSTNQHFEEFQLFGENFHSIYAYPQMNFLKTYQPIRQIYKLPCRNLGSMLENKAVFNLSNDFS